MRYKKVVVAVSGDELDKIKVAAERESLTVSSWARRIMLQIIRKEAGDARQDGR